MQDMGEPSLDNGAADDAGGFDNVFSQTVLPPSQPGEDFTGENLVQAPNMVRDIPGFYRF